MKQYQPGVGVALAPMVMWVAQLGGVVVCASHGSCRLMELFVHGVGALVAAQRFQVSSPLGVPPAPYP